MGNKKNFKEIIFFYFKMARDKFRNLLPKPRLTDVKLPKLKIPRIRFSKEIKADFSTKFKKRLEEERRGVVRRRRYDFP